MFICGKREIEYINYETVFMSLPNSDDYQNIKTYAELLNGTVYNAYDLSSTELFSRFLEIPGYASIFHIDSFLPIQRLIEEYLLETGDIRPILILAPNMEVNPEFHFPNIHFFHSLDAVNIFTILQNSWLNEQSRYHAATKYISGFCNTTAIIAIRNKACRDTYYQYAKEHEFLAIDLYSTKHFCIQELVLIPNTIVFLDSYTLQLIRDDLKVQTTKHMRTLYYVVGENCSLPFKHERLVSRELLNDDQLEKIFSQALKEQKELDSVLRDIEDTD